MFFLLLLVAVYFLLLSPAESCLDAQSVEWQLSFFELVLVLHHINLDFFILKGNK